MTQDNLIALKPCPFCGNDGSGPIESALQIVFAEERFKWTVQCDKCTATMGYFESEDEAIEAWNTRQDVRNMPLASDLSPPLDAKERLMAEFQREERYLVIKRKHLTKAREEALRAYLFDDGIETVECVVVEKDWPEYEPVWAMIEQRCGPRPNLDGEGVIQADRERFAEVEMARGTLSVGQRERVLIGEWDNDERIQAFAAHRRAALASMSPDPAATHDPYCSGAGPVSECPVCADTISTPREDEVKELTAAEEAAINRAFRGSVEVVGRMEHPKLRQVAMELREACVLAEQLYRDGLLNSSDEFIEKVHAKRRSALASADAVMGEGE